MIGPFWCQDLEGWIRFETEGNQFVVKVAIKESDTRTSDWQILDGAVGPWTLYYGDGETDTAPTTYKLEDNTLYRTQGEFNNYMGLLHISKLTPTKPNWTQHHPRQFHPFPEYEQKLKNEKEQPKEVTTITPYAKLPLTPEMREEAAKKEQERQEALEKEQHERKVQFQKSVIAQRRAIREAVDNEHLLLSPEHLGRLGLNDIDPGILNDIREELANAVHGELLTELIDANDNIEDYLNDLKGLIEAPKDGNKILKLSAKTFFDFHENFNREAETLIILEQMKRNYCLALLKKEGTILAQKFSINIDFTHLQIPEPQVSTVGTRTTTNLNTRANPGAGLDDLTPEEIEWINSQNLDAGIDDLTSDEIEWINNENQHGTYPIEVEGDEFPILLDDDTDDVVNGDRPSVAPLKFDEIKDAVIRAQEKYAKWYRNERVEHSRGPNGFFTWFRHTALGQTRAEKLKNTVVDFNQWETTDDEKLGIGINEINDFLTDKKTNYNLHSFSSFLLDELTKIKSSPWQGLTLTKNHYNKDKVAKAIEQYKLDTEHKLEL